MEASMINKFVAAARVLDLELVPPDRTSNGLKQLHFKVDEKVFTAIEQNKEKLSGPAALAREDHRIYQIRDNAAGVLVGNVDLTARKFSQYNYQQEIIDIQDIEKALKQAKKAPTEDFVQDAFGSPERPATVRRQPQPTTTRRRNAA